MKNKRILKNGKKINKANQLMMFVANL